MAAGANNAEAERAFSRAQLKLNLNLPSIDTPRSLSDLQSIAHEIQRQKNEVLCHLKHEDKDRHSYFTQLEHLARQMRELPLPTDSPTLEYELERTRLELETQRMQDRMLKTLGPTSEVVRRREERILHLRKLDQKLAEINTLIVNHVGKSEAAASDLCHTTSTSPALPGDWTNDKDIWLSGSSLDLHHEDKNGHSDTASVMSFTSSIHSSHGISGSGGSGGLLSDRAQKLPMGPKVEVVYNLLTMLFSHDRHNVSQKLLHMSANPETRTTLHQVGCIPLLVQLIYNQDGGGEAANQDRSNLANATASSWMLTEADKETRASAAQALHNLVYNSCDDRKVKREIRILKLLELIRSYADRLRDAILHQLHHHDQEIDNRLPLLLDDDMDSHPCAVVTNLMKLSFDDDHRQAMSHLGALQGLSELLHLDQLAHGSLCDDAQCTTLRRYASMTLTNLTFGHGPNKTLLCSTRPLLAVLSHQLASPNDDLRQVTASVLRNLSWRADSASKDALQQTNVVQSLITMSMETHRESTLKSMLSALWNLSSHSSCNKATICATPGSLEFLVRTLTYKSESKTLSIVESGGGIVRNISSHIATRDDYRATLRRHGCFQILLHHLRSPSLTVVSNACGTLWNLSARCKEDQSTLRDLGAIPMLRNLVHSRHKMIATASSAALKNLESGGFGSSNGSLSNSGNATSHNTSLQARKQKALEQEIDQTLTEMCDNIDPLSPLEEPAGVSPFDRRMYRSLGGHNTTSLYSRASAAPALVPKSGSTPIRPIRSSSLERKNAAVDAIASGGGGGLGCPRTMTPSVPSTVAASPAVAMGSRLQATRTVWHSHENEISYTSLNYEEDDQPVNYSLKYTEEVVSVPVATHWTPSRPSKPPIDGDNNTEGSDPVLQSGDQMNPSTVKKAMVLSAYRETDLDEPERPTDFSLRYPDEDEDYAADSDTMQTYCMEGTPYETPFTRSSAASLNDLREAGLESPKMEQDDPVEKIVGQETKPNCEENDDEEEAEGDKVEGKTPPMPRRLQPANKESKTVTFNTTADCEINYSEQQTPLMFSRSSSLESLDSLDQQQNCHDEGSVVSEFSRLTSRAVSPSELPDSPGQTMPSSPRRPQGHHSQQQDQHQQQQHQQQQQQQHQQHQMQQQQQQLPKPLQRVQHAEGVFDDTTNNFGMEGTPAFTRAASPLSQLSFDDEPSSPTNPTPPTPPPPPIVTASRPPMPVPSSVPASSSSANQLVNPTFNRVIRSASEVNFRSTFDYDEPRRFNEEDSPALTRWTSLSSLHIDGEVISTAKLLPPSHGVGNLDSAHLTERKVEQNIKVEVVSMAAASDPVPIESNEWSEESGSEDDLLLEIITQGKPTSRQPAPQPAKSCKPAITEAGAPPVFRPHVPKSASVQEFSHPARSSSIPPSQSVDSSLSKGNIRDIGSDVEDDDDDDDDEMLYACIRSAKPTAKPVPPPRTSSISSKSTPSIPPPPPSNGVQKSRHSRPPMELPKSTSASSKERVPPLHGPFSNVRQMAIRVKSSTEVTRSSGRRSRHSSQGSSRMGASGCSNNTSVDLDYRYSYKVEDTPVTFSRNSSLSSLSVNSNEDEPSAEDQALLDSCISWGMPKSKSDYLDGRSDQNKKTKATKTSGAKIPTSQSWSGGVRRAGDGQASASPSTVTVTTSSSFSAFSASASNFTGNAIDPSDIVVKLEEPDPNGSPSMTHSSLIRMEANQIAAQIQSQDSLDGSSQCNDLEHFPSLTSSFIDGAASWTDTTRKSPSLTRKTQQSNQTDSNRGRTPVNGANPLLKQALSSGLVISTEQSNMTSSTSTSFRIENTKPPADLMVSKVTDSFASLTCSVLDPCYFDDEQRREGLLTQLAIMEHTVDENANTDSSVSSSPTGERRKLTPRDRRQADKERYQTYTLNANPVEETVENRFNPDNSTQNNCDETKKTAKQRRSSERERFMTQTISSSNTTGSDGEMSAGKTDTTESANQKSMSASELSALEMDAKAVIRTLKEEVKLNRQKSNSSELISEDCMLDCETLSLVSNESESERSLSHRAKQMVLHQDGLENNEVGDMRKTKIVRPDDQKFLEDPNAIKGIRGRRRVLCPVRVAPVNGPNRPVVNSSPPQQQQLQQQQAYPAMTTSPAKINGTKTTPVSRAAQSRGRSDRSASPASPSPVRPNRTSALRQNTSQSQKSKYPSVPVLESQVRLRSNSKSPRVSSAPCSPRQLPVAEPDSQQLKRRSLEMTSRTSVASLKSSPPKSESVPVIDSQHPPLATIGKQGTFTKEKSSSPEGAAAKEEEQSVKIPPKVPPKPKIAPAAKPALPKKPSRFNNGPSPLSSPRSKGSPALSRRSVSSASIGSDSTSVTTTWSGVDEQTSSSTPPQKRTPPKKVVTSKIASLWKQVEESRSKQKSEQPDVRKWISRGDNAKPSTEDKSVGTGCSPDQTPRPIVSSGTFEKLSSFSNTQQVPVISPATVNSPSSDKRSPPSRLPFRLPRFGRSSSQSSTPTTPTLPTPPSPSFDVSNSSSSAETEDKRKFRVTAL